MNVPRRGMEEIVAFCGAVSGREHNKFKEKGLTLLPGKMIRSPAVAECIMNYECTVAYKARVLPEFLPEDIISTCYPHGDYHTLYFGEIVATYADEDLARNL